MKTPEQKPGEVYRRKNPIRFAGEAFAHWGNPPDGPTARKVTSTIAWKQPPAASVQAEVSR
jgi:hypothetical protein